MLSQANSRCKAIYALYKGEELLTTGTAAEIARERGVDIKTIYYYQTPRSRKRDKGKRMVLERIE